MGERKEGSILDRLIIRDLPKKRTLGRKDPKKMRK